MNPKRIASRPSLATHPYFRHETQPGDEQIVHACGRPLAYVALHEAAHAVVALALCVRVERLTIRLPRPRAMIRLSSEATEDCIERGDPTLAAIALAGLIVDWNVLGKKVSFSGELDIESDQIVPWAWAQVTAGEFDPRRPRALVSDLWTSVETILIDNNAALIRVARAALLAPSRSLDAARIARAAGRLKRFKASELIVIARAA